jgi:hypothetical protein
MGLDGPTVRMHPARYHKFLIHSASVTRDRHEGGSMNKKEAKLKKRKDRE